MEINNDISTKKTLLLDSMHNFRQLPRTTSKITGKPTVYRSSRPDFLTGSDLVQFENLKIKTIIDLRSLREYFASTGSLEVDSIYRVSKIVYPRLRFSYRHSDVVKSQPLRTSRIVLPAQHDQCTHYILNFFRVNYIAQIFLRAKLLVKIYSLFILFFDIILRTKYFYLSRLLVRNVVNKKDLLGQYKDMLKYSKNAICAALKILITPGNVPAMISCAHGKDRTGVVSALILSLLGASREEIVQDYAESQISLAPIRERVIREMKHFHLNDSFLHAEPNTMRQFLEHIDETYGSVQNYLVGAGFTLEDQKRLVSIIG